MKYSFTALAAAMVLSCTSLTAHADVIVPVGGTHEGVTFQGAKLDWNYSTSLLSFIDVTQLVSQPIPPATLVATITYDEDIGANITSQARITTPVTAMGVGATGQISSAYTVGGVAWTTPRAAGISQGGTLSITNLTIDLASQRILGSITGNFSGVSYNNGVAVGSAGTDGAPITTFDNFHLWDFSSLAGDTTWPALATSGGSLSISQVRFTQDAFAHVVSALRLGNTGTSVLHSVNNLGTLSISPVPEPSSAWLLMGGLLSLTCLRHHQSTRSRA
jgi:hypothetical protein